MPRRSNDVYQVDLIAALFGGFMIAWLTSAQEVDYQLETTEIAFATLDVKLIGTSNSRLGGEEVWIGVLPKAMQLSDYSCLSESLSTEIDSIVYSRSLKKINICQRKSIDRLRGGETNKLISVMKELREECFVKATDTPLRKYQSVNQSHVLDISISGFKPNTMYAGLLKTDNYFSIDPSVKSLNGAFIDGLDGHTKCLIPSDLGQFITVMMIPDRDDVDESALGLKLGSGKAKNFFEMKTVSGEAKGNLSKEYQARAGSKYIFDTGVLDDLENLAIVAELCIHTGGSAECFIGSGAYVPNSNIPLSKRN